jgi:enediyne biosynthesis protein E4
VAHFSDFNIVSLYSVNQSIRFFAFISLILFNVKCDHTHKAEKLFQLLSSNETGITFSNDLVFTEEYNPYTFKNFFNGGGVGVGDINNDGLMDIYFAGNLTDNKLYLNKGNFVFEDITENAGLLCKDVWSSGVTFVDINADGWTDIYICKSGKPGGNNRHNELFINNGDLTFTEKSKEFELDFTGLSTHAAFFDYDRDGDLDCYLLNNSIRSVGGYDIVEGLREITDTTGGNRLLRNEHLKRYSADSLITNPDIRYIDVSKSAGIYGSAIGFGLGVSISDLNGDQWPDLYVSNDFFERDYLYLNNQDGTFREVITSATQEISLGSMGADIADIDNDGLPDIFVTEMLPQKMFRYKTKSLFENWDKYTLNGSKGYHKQFGRNVLQINQGNCGEKDDLRFTEISRYCGLDATDWSWGALIADYNNDGNRDIFIANGIYKDLTDLDYVNFDFNPEAIKGMIDKKEQVISRMMEKVPSEPQQNYLFLNKGNYNFTNAAELSGIEKPTFSNGSVYADLDNDGDLDLITNNINEKAHVYRNNTEKSADNTFINISLKGSADNIQALGAKVICYAGKDQIMQELNPMRGFESCVDPRIHIGLGKINHLDSIIIFWPDGSKSLVNNPGKLNTFVTYDYSKLDKTKTNKTIFSSDALLTEVTNRLDLLHVENEFSDFDRDRLLFYMLSNEGPHLAVKDLNNDGLEDVVLGGSSGYSTQIAYQQKNGTFIKKEFSVFKQNAVMEDSRILIEDFNDDGFQDIFVCGGGSELPNTSAGLKDRLYLGSKNGFIENPEIFNGQYNSTSSVVWIDMDADGDKDIFAGGRMESFNYGIPATSFVYENNHGKYALSPSLSAPFRQYGMIVDATSSDINGDGVAELILLKDLSNVDIFKVQRQGIQNITSSTGLLNVKGFWTSMRVEDIDDDGDSDILVCNKGLNNRLSADYGSFEMHVNDFDGNGQIEQISCYTDSSRTFPWVMRDDLVKQLPGLKKRLLKYHEFAAADLSTMFDQGVLKNSVVYKVNEFRSGIFRNDNGIFTFVPLPEQAQWTDQKASLIADLNGDGKKDIILGGNQMKARPEMGIDAGSYGMVFINQGNLHFNYLRNLDSGLCESGEIRDIKSLKNGKEQCIIISKNNERIKLYKINKIKK